MNKVYLMQTSNSKMTKYIGQIGYIQIKETFDRPHVKFISLVTNDWLFETSGVMDIKTYQDEIIYITRNSVYRFKTV